MPQPTLRFATRDDVPLILEFIRDLATYERLAGAVVATEEDLHRTLFGQRAYAEVLLAEVDGEPAGFALFFHNYSTFLGRPGLYLEDLFVRRRWRGQGVGLALMRELARLAVSRGCGRCEWACLDWNEPALSFYRRLGAEPQRDWTVHRLTGDALQRLAGCDEPQENSR